MGLLRPSLPWCFPIRGPAAAAGGKGSQCSKQQQEEKDAKIIIFYAFQTLRYAFSGCNWSFSVLHCHGVFPSGDQQQQQQKPLQQQEEKVAKIHSSSKRKKPPKSSFSMISEITLAIFGMQFWGFSVLHCHCVFPSGDQQQQQQKPLQQQEERVAKFHSSSKRKKPPKSSCSMGFRSYVRAFSGCNFGASPSFTAMVFSHPGTSSSSSKSLCSSRRKR